MHVVGAVVVLVHEMFTKTSTIHLRSVGSVGTEFEQMKTVYARTVGRWVLVLQQCMLLPLCVLICRSIRRILQSTHPQHQNS